MQIKRDTCSKGRTVLILHTNYISLKRLFFFTCIFLSIENPIDLAVVIGLRGYMYGG